MPKKESQKRVFSAVVVLLSLIIIFFALELLNVSFGNKNTLNVRANSIDIRNLNPKNFVELEEISNYSQSFNKLSDFFEEVAKEKGGAYAFNLLRLADLPPGTDLHLLGHVVGDVLYKQKGLDGIHSCTQDFRNACSHSIVVGLFYKEGEGALDEISDACRNAPGGKGAYTMCFHGLGHGVLAYAGYDLEKAVDLCRQTGTSQYNDREYVECIGGTIMEIIGGVHDREAWERQYKKYFKDDDPLYPCSAPFIPDKVKGICYNYLTPHLFKSAGGSLSNPNPSFKKAFTYCDVIPKERVGDRTTCFGGFGKEFIVLAKERDIRDIGVMTEEQVRKVYDWCRLAPHKEGTNACIQFAMSSMYWGGENDYGSALVFCDTIDDSEHKDGCYNGLIANVTYYRGDSADRSYVEEFCQGLPGEYQDRCGRRR